MYVIAYININLFFFQSVISQILNFPNFFIWNLILYETTYQPKEHDCEDYIILLISNGMYVRYEGKQIF